MIMTRDARHDVCSIFLHTIMKTKRICPHEMSRHHGVGSSERGSQKDSIIHDNENSV
jgi:hypothetical protein